MKRRRNLPNGHALHIRNLVLLPPCRTRNRKRRLFPRPPMSKRPRGLVLTRMVRHLEWLSQKCMRTNLPGLWNLGPGVNFQYGDAVVFSWEFRLISAGQFNPPRRFGRCEPYFMTPTARAIFLSTRDLTKRTSNVYCPTIPSLAKEKFTPCLSRWTSLGLPSY